MALKNHIVAVAFFSMLFCFAAVYPSHAYGDCQIGYQDPNPTSGYSIGIGAYEGGLDAAQLVTANCSGALSELNWKGWKTENRPTSPEIWVWDTQPVVNGECPGFGQLVTNFSSSSICPKSVVAKTLPANIPISSEYAPVNVVSTFETPFHPVVATQYFFDIRLPNDEVTATTFYGAWYAPNITAQGVHSWKRGTGNGSTAFRWWPDAHGALHIWGTIDEDASPPPPPPPPPPPAMGTSTVPSLVTRSEFGSKKAYVCVEVDLSSVVQ